MEFNRDGFNRDGLYYTILTPVALRSGLVTK
jgi:hypothetical protein